MGAVSARESGDAGVAAEPDGTDPDPRVSSGGDLAAP